MTFATPLSITFDLRCSCPVCVLDGVPSYFMTTRGSWSLHSGVMACSSQVKLCVAGSRARTSIVRALPSLVGGAGGCVADHGRVAEGSQSWRKDGGALTRHNQTIKVPTTLIHLPWMTWIIPGSWTVLIPPSEA